MLNDEELDHAAAVSCDALCDQRRLFCFTTATGEVVMLRDIIAQAKEANALRAEVGRLRSYFTDLQLAMIDADAMKNGPLTIEKLRTLWPRPADD